MEIEPVIVFAFCFVIPSSADIAEFVHGKMQEFPAYIQENNMEPTPLDEQTQFFLGSNEWVSMTSQLKDFVLSGYSAGIYVEYISDWLDGGQFNVSLVSNVSSIATGMHDTSWLVNGTRLRSQGHWVSHQWSVHFEDCGIHFSVLPSGYLNVTQVVTCYPSWQFHNVSFDGISDNEAAAGYQKFIEPLLQNAADGQRFRSTETVSNTFGQFWTDILSNTTLGDVIGHTGIYVPSSTTQHL